MKLLLNFSYSSNHTHNFKSTKYPNAFGSCIKLFRFLYFKTILAIFLIITVTIVEAQHSPCKQEDTKRVAQKTYWEKQNEQQSKDLVNKDGLEETDGDTHKDEHSFCQHFHSLLMQESLVDIIFLLYSLLIYLTNNNQKAQDFNKRLNLCKRGL